MIDHRHLPVFLPPLGRSQTLTSRFGVDHITLSQPDGLVAWLQAVSRQLRALVRNVESISDDEAATEPSLLPQTPIHFVHTTPAENHSIPQPHCSFPMSFVESVSPLVAELSPSPPKSQPTVLAQQPPCRLLLRHCDSYCPYAYAPHLVHMIARSECTLALRARCFRGL